MCPCTNRVNLDVLLMWGVRMSSLSKREARELLENVERISDERVTYFYMMLGSALADAMSQAQPMLGASEARANSSPKHLQEIAKRISS